MPKIKAVMMRKLASLVARPAADSKTQNDMPTCLRLLAKQNVDTFLIASDRNPGIDYVDTHFGNEMHALNSVRSFRRAELKNTNHTFTSSFAQHLVANTIVDRITSRHLA